MIDLEKVKELALANNFKLKEQASGKMDLNSYVYDFAEAVKKCKKEFEKLKAEIDTLKEKLANFESGEFVMVRKRNKIGNPLNAFVWRGVYFAEEAFSFDYTGERRVIDGGV